MTTTFDSVALKNVAPREPEISNDSWEITLDCATNDYSDITAIQAKAGTAKKKTLLSGKTAIQTTGTKGTLSLEGVSYTNCVIMEAIDVKEQRGTGSTPWWKYTVRIAQETKS